MAKTQLDKLQEKISKADTEAAKAAKRAKVLKSQMSEIRRRQETKMKILYGSAVMQMFKADEELKRRVDNFLPGFLKRDADRAVFGLDPLPKDDGQ